MFPETGLQELIALHFRRGTVPPAGEAFLPPPQLGKDVPEISRFYGIVVGMYYNDHGRPHFHARYGRKKISIYIPELEVRTGELPSPVLRLLIEWAAQHREELMEDWDLARQGEPLKRIRPLQ